MNALTKADLAKRNRAVPPKTVKATSAKGKATATAKTDKDSAKTGKTTKTTTAAPVTATPAAPAKPVVKKNTFTRDDATAAAIRKLCKSKNGATLKEITAESNLIYKEKGHETTTKAKNVIRYMLAGLVAFKVLELKDKKYIFA